MSRFLHELKRRRVFRVAAMYSAVAFVVWRAADIAFPALHLPAWLVTAVVALTIIGFPIALVLAWAFDITPAGVQRTQPDADVRAAADAVGSTTETRVVAVAAMIVIAIAAAAAFALRRDRGAPPDAGRVLVMTFENLAGDASLDPVGRMAAEWLTQGLAVTGIVEVIPAITVVTAVRAAGSGADLTSARQIALELGAGTVVWGTYFTSGGRLSFSAHIFDAARGRLIGSLEPVTAPLDYPAAGLVELRERVMSGLGAMLNPRLAGWPGATSQPWSWAAYQEYADGMERYVASDYFGAATHFGRSFAMDSALLVAALWQANSNANGIDIDAAFETAAWLENRRERLAPYDRAFLDRLRARLRGDLPAMHRASLRMLERRNRLSALAGLALAATLLGDHDAAARSNRRDRGDAVRQRAVARAVRAQPRRRRAPDARGVRERAAAFHESDGISGPLSRSGAAPAARAFRLPRAGAATDGGVTMKRRCASRRLAPAASCITRT